MKRNLILLFLMCSFNVAPSWALTVHEWGTFTSMVGSNGEILSQMHHEEEPLPTFVYDLARLLREEKGRDFNPDNFPPTRSLTPRSMDRMPIPIFTTRVTQKMETPVLYFYLNDSEKKGKSDTLKVDVDVTFPKGLISQWYPKADSFNHNDEELKYGKIHWAVDVLKEKTGDLPFTSDESIWNPSRLVNSHLVKVEDDLEKFIFYRGLADFTTPLSLKVSSKEIILQNTGDAVIEKSFLVETKSDNQFKIIPLEDLVGHSSLSFSLERIASEKSLTREKFLQKAKSSLEVALIKTGLYPDEAKSMVETWANGYFLTPGLRLLYIIPKKQVEEILPLKISPQPEELQRTLVGRIEILTLKEEEQLVIEVKKLAASNSSSSELLNLEVNGKFMEGLGHFPGPKLERVKALIPANDKVTLDFIQSTLELLNTGVNFR